jgi:hypothetical protein
VRSEATIKDTEALANLKQLIRGWEQAKLKGFPGLEADVAAARETVRELEERLAAEESCDE